MSTGHVEDNLDFRLLLAGCGTPQRGANFDGVWVNENPNTTGITRIQIVTAEDTLYVEMWGKCHPTDCYWGIAKTSTFDALDGAIELTWYFDFATETQTLRLLGSNWMRVDGFVDFHPWDGREDYSYTEYFRRES